MEVIALALALAIITEGIVEYLGAPIPSAYKPYAAAVLGILVCVAYNADVLALLGQPSVPYVGAVLTGVMVSRGASYVNDLVSKLGVVPVPAAPVDVIEDQSKGAFN